MDKCRAVRSSTGFYCSRCSTQWDHDDIKPPCIDEKAYGRSQIKLLKETLKNARNDRNPNRTYC